MLIYDNEYETKENKNWTKDKIELQHIHCYIWTSGFSLLKWNAKEIRFTDPASWEALHISGREKSKT